MSRFAYEVSFISALVIVPSKLEKEVNPNIYKKWQLRPIIEFTICPNLFFGHL